MNLNIIPNGAIKRVHVSQNDVGRTLTFELFNGSSQYTIPVGATVKIQGTKPSGFGFSETCTVSGNIVTVDTTEEMTDEHGYIDTELQITYSGNTIGTSNFVLAIEKNPHPDTTTDGSMETIIPELTLLVNEVKGYAEEIESTYHAYGSPWVASTVAQMTDTDKIYVYTGSETGYTNGNWYYYNGSAWVSGGVYNAVAVQTDTTLTQSGVPADAKAVGDIALDSEVETDLTSTYVVNKMYSLNGRVGTALPSVANSSTLASTKIDVTDFEYIKIQGTALQIQRLWCFADSNNIMLAKASGTVEANVSADDYLILKVPSNAKYFVSNVKKSETYSLKAVNRTYLNKVKDALNWINSQIICDVPIIKEVGTLYHDVTAWQSYATVLSWYDDLVTAYPNYVKRVQLGYDSSGSYTMYKYIFEPPMPTLDNAHTDSPFYKKNNIPTVFMQACIHGVEAPCAVGLAEFMCQIAHADGNDIFAWLRQNIRFVVIPIVNPWGYTNGERVNYNGVDLNRNYPSYWENGVSDSSSDRYRGTSVLSEKEVQYSWNEVTVESGNLIFAYDWHTFGSFGSFERMTAFSYGDKYRKEFEKIGYATIKQITSSCHKYHNLDSDSGYIGVVQDYVLSGGMFGLQSASLNIPMASPEVMYRYYDGGTGNRWTTDINSARVEYIEFAVVNALNTFLRKVSS